MNERPPDRPATRDSRAPTWPGEIGRKEQRKLSARREKDRSLWFGLGMFGLVGWSVAIPALFFLAIGIWLDKAFPNRISWTLTLLVTGVIIGCLHAWFWVTREGRHD